MKRKLLAIASLALLPLYANAMDYKGMNSTAQPWWSPENLYIGASQGYGNMNNMLHNDGQGAIGRLVFGLDVYTMNPVTFALELGLQNGRTMRHAPASNDPTADLDLPIQTTLNPVDDLLLSVRIPIACQFYGMLKGGMAYRQLQFHDGDFVSSLNQISGEFQAGIGYELTKHTRLIVYYQGIYANGDVSYTQNSNGYVNVSNIPTQQAGFIGFEISL
jgi:hypothetical protein